MNIDHNYPQLAIDPSTFSRALEGDALDTCLDYLRSQEIADPEAARLACCLGERLFHSGRRGEAVECGRRAFAAAANDNHVVHFCAWLFSNCGSHRDAVAAYQRLLEHRPGWIEGYRHASGALLAMGERDKAIDFAMRASDLDPTDADFACHAGALLLDAQRYEAAEAYLAHALAIEPDHPAALRGLSAAYHARGREGDALNLALRAAELAPDETHLVIHAAELLLRAGQVDAAAVLLRGRLAHAPADAMLWRLLSEAEAQREKVPAALDAIDRALTLAPGNADYHLHRGHLLYRRGDFAEAARAVHHAAEIDPGSQATQRAQINLLLLSGRLSAATEAGGELLRAFPEDEASAETVLRVLNRRLDTIDGDYVVLRDRADRLPRPPRGSPRTAERLKAQARVIHALIIRETRTRFGDSRLGYGWALIEPILHITLLWVMFSLLMHGTPPIGTHFFLFYFSGLVPFHVFVHTSTSMMHGVTGNAALLQLPPVKPFDVILARGLLEFATDVVVAVLLLAGFAAAGLPALPVGQSASGPISQAVELGCRVIASRTHTFLEFARYHPETVEFFDIGNHLELAERIAARRRYMSRRDNLRYTVETNKAVYLAANSPPADHAPAARLQGHTRQLSRDVMSAD